MFNYIRLKFGDMKIKYKLIVSYYPITFCIIAIVGLLANRIAVKTIREQSLMIVTQSQQQVTYSINNYLGNYQYFVKNIFLSSAMQQFVLGESTDGEYDDVKRYREFEKSLLTWLSVLAKPTNLALVRYNNNLNEIINNNFHSIISADNDTDILNGGTIYNYQIYNVNRLEDRQWYRENKDKFREFTWLQVDEDSKFGNVSLIKEIPNYNTFKHGVGLIIMTVRLKDIFNMEDSRIRDKYFFNMVFDDNDNMVYIDGENMDFYEANKDRIRELLQDEKASGVHYIENNSILKAPIGIEGWRLLSVVPMNELSQKAAYIKNFVIVCCVLALLILFVISYYLSNSFSKRIIKICSYMQEFQEGNFNKKLKNIHKDELGFLGQSFNEMSLKTNKLIEEVYRANIDKREAQLKTLQAQINPHFLYNSLSSISRLANKGEINKINTMVSSLVTFYRMSLSKGKDVIMISDEISQAKAYIEVLNIRMGSDFKTTFEIDESVLRYTTVKVILQPFIENIFEHAIYDRDNPINIRIQIRGSEDCIMFKVIDDGVGISKENQRRLFTDEAKEGKGFGVKNVNDRIRLHFGQMYGVRIFSRSGIGTTVLITIPKQI